MYMVIIYMYMCRTVPPNVVSDSDILKDSKSLEMSHVHTIF